MALNNGLGRPKIVAKFNSVFEYLKGYVFPEKHILEKLKEDVYAAEKALRIAENKRGLQQTKIDNAYNNLEYFNK